MKRLLLSFAVLLSFFCANAQLHHEIGVQVGVANYYGDLQDKVFPSDGYRPMAGIIYKYFVSPHVGVRFGASHTSITAADSLSAFQVKRDRNLRFATNITEVHGGLELNLLPIGADKFKVTPYVFGGIGLFYFNPYTDGPNNEKVYLRPLSTEGQGLAEYPDRKEYSRVNVALPIGGGLKFFVGKTLMITTELGFRYTTTDYLDDVSKSYVDLNVLKQAKGQQSIDLSYRGDERATWDGSYYPNYKYQRGDSKANDWYWYGGINVAIYFDAFGNVSKWWMTRCPRIVRGRDHASSL